MTTKHIILLISAVLVLASLIPPVPGFFLHLGVLGIIGAQFVP